MENNNISNADNNLALQNQETLGSKTGNMFFEQIQRNLSSMSEEEIIKKITDRDFETLGMICFIVGIDYTGQQWRQNKVITNVRKRLEEVKLSEKVIEIFTETINNLKGVEVEQYWNTVIESNKNCVTRKIEVSNENRLVFNQILINIKAILNKLIVPIGYASTIYNIKKEDLTYEHLFKFNSLVSKNSSYRGVIHRRLSELYGDPYFNQMLQDMMNKYDLAKYTFIYAESIQSVIDSLNRFAFDLSPVDAEVEKQQEEEFNKQQEELISEKEEPKAKKSYSDDESADIMQNNPDLFIETILGEQIDLGDEPCDVIPEEFYLACIDKLIEKEELLQHVYMYLNANKSHKNRIEEEYYQDLVDLLQTKIGVLNEQYKKLAEFNCKELEEEQKQRIISYVNNCIEVCIMSDENQKQYLISQLIENGITTYNHLQQIMSIIETCTIYGEDSNCYVDLYNYIQDKTNIKEVFDNANVLSKLELQLQVYTAFKNWYTISTK